MAVKNRILLLKEYLEENTDEGRSATTGQIKDYLAEHGCPVTTQTLRTDIESLREFDSSGYIFISQAYLVALNRDFERCKLMMKVSDEDLEVFRTQHQKLLEATSENAAQDVLKASRDNQQRKQKLQQAREEGMKEGL